MSGMASDDEHTATKELLLAELATFEESIWRSEETGEKRFNFLISLITAVAGGLAALWTIKPAGDFPVAIASGILLAVLLCGIPDKPPNTSEAPEKK